MFIAHTAINTSHVVTGNACILNSHPTRLLRCIGEKKRIGSKYAHYGMPHGGGA